MKELAVHALVRDFCRDKQEGETWRARLRDAAAFYTNSTKLIERENKTQAAIWLEMEAFELLMEAENFNEAARLLTGATRLLDRWGFGQYAEGQHRRLFDKLDAQETAVILHNFGILIQSRGDYEKALEYYNRSLKIQEELSDRSGIANSFGQIGKLYIEVGRYDEAFQHFLLALSILIELQSPNARLAATHLKELRAKWGEENFDAAWREATGEDVPEWLKE